MGVYLLLVLLAVSCPLAAPARVRVAQGTLVGTTVTTRGGRQVLAFLGVPYAAPPTGRLRFKSPQPPTSWTGERNASQEGSACIQQFALLEKLRNIVSGSEDCLFLNVYTPEISLEGRLPVMFYIHGGGYAGGSGSIGEYGPQLLLDRHVVLVTINYRLGPLGFLSTGDTVLPGNLGLKDQLAALQWVQDNIEHFGGNKNSVTIFGESAGGASVHFHLLSQRSKGLFHAAVSQSGTALCPWAMSSPIRHKQVTARLAELVDCPLNSSQALLDCLMVLPAERIVDQLRHFIVWDMDPVVVFNPCVEPEEVEDAFLTSDPWSLSAHLPWMVGFNQHEGALKVSSLTQGDVAGKFKQLNENFYSILPMSLLYQLTAEEPDEVTRSLRTFYLGDVEEVTSDMVPQLIKMYTDGWFTYGVLEAARRHSGPVFVYEFAYNSSVSMCSVYFNNPQYFGVCHFDELKFLFPMEGYAPQQAERDPDYIMSSHMVQLWTNFAKNKVPSLDVTKDIWVSSNGSVEDYLFISQDGFALKQHLHAERDHFWQNLPFRQKAVQDTPQVNVGDEL